jgi:hypothetical protein
MNQEILDYLKSAKPDYYAGLALFCKYSRNDWLKNWLSRKQDRAKLMYELEKLSNSPHISNPNEQADVARYAQKPVAVHEPVAAAPVSDPVPVVKPAPAFKTFDDRRTRRSDLPAELQAVYDSISEDYKLRRGLHEKMKAAGTNNDRASFRVRVLETDARIKAGWAKIDAYLTREAEEKVSGDSFQESTCRAYISKALKRPVNSPAQVATCKARVKALLDHGCTISPETMKLLQNKGLYEKAVELDGVSPE